MHSVGQLKCVSAQSWWITLLREWHISTVNLIIDKTKDTITLSYKIVSVLESNEPSDIWVS